MAVEKAAGWDGRGGNGEDGVGGGGEGDSVGGGSGSGSDSGGGGSGGGGTGSSDMAVAVVAGRKKATTIAAGMPRVAGWREKGWPEGGEGRRQLRRH